MKRNLGRLAVAGTILAHTCYVHASDDPAGRTLIREAQQLIAAYHDGQPRASNALRVVYFVPKDREPLPNYAERLDRVVNDVNDFYRDGLRRFGIETAGLPLERKEGKLVLHLVRGQLPASEYHHESGNVTAREIRLALEGTMDLEHEHLLVFYALCRKEANGAYVFDAPYYGEGGSSQKNGLCHAADCELLDPLLLTETNRTMVFTEHNYSHLKMTVAQFNSWYLGGVAHELGHALGLPHDDGGGEEKSFGTSLMGGGNLTYRQELWGGGNPAHHLGVWSGAAPTYLGRAAALQLASHPLISGSDRGRWDAIESGFKSLEFSATNGTVRIQGVATSAVPAYAVIAYVWPKSAKTDHQARTFPGLLKEGVFLLELNGLRPDTWRLKLAMLQVNGATATQEFVLPYDGAAAPDVAALNAEWIVDQAERAVMTRQPNARKLVNDQALAAAPTPTAAGKLQLLRTVLDPVDPLDLSTVTNGNVFLSDAAWTDAQVGWGQVARNYFWFDQRIQDGVFLLLCGRFYDKGLYAHSPARYVFPVNRNWKTFTATIGLRDGANAEQGSAVFTVRGDGRELYRSHILRVGMKTEVKVDISKVKTLELLTDGGEGHNHSSWAIWVEPKVLR